MLFQIIFIIISVFCKSYSSRYSSSSKVVIPHSITTVNLRSQLPQQNTVGTRWSEGQVELNLKYLALFQFLAKSNSLAAQLFCLWITVLPSPERLFSDLQIRPFSTNSVHKVKNYNR